MICDLKSVDEEDLAFPVQGLYCGLLFFSGETLALHVQGSVQWIAIL